MCILQPSHKSRSVVDQENIASAQLYDQSSSSQTFADAAEYLATSGSQHESAGGMQSSPATCHMQQRSNVAQSDQSTGQPFPSPGKQRLICSVDVPGIGRAEKVNYVKYQSVQVFTEGILSLAKVWTL